jgi:hypothetical protein
MPGTGAAAGEVIQTLLFIDSCGEPASASMAGLRKKIRLKEQIAETGHNTVVA